MHLNNIIYPIYNLLREIILMLAHHFLYIKLLLLKPIIKFKLFYAYIKRSLVLYTIQLLLIQPSNLNYNYNFGIYALVVLGLQIIWNFFSYVYCPSASVLFLVLNTLWEISLWMVCSLSHANGASFFFIVVYAHLFRGLYYGSYYYPASFMVFWCYNFIINDYTSFLGYVLPWGQMSYWAVL